MVTLHEVITFLISMQISISSLQTHNVNRCGRSRHLARKVSLTRKRSSAYVFEMAATETITSIILIKLIRVSLGTVRHPRRFKIVVIDIQITLKQMLRDFIGARRTGKDVNSHTVLDGIITTIMATIQKINIIGSREGSRNRRRLKANQTGKKFRVGIKSNISTNRNNLISGVDRCIHLNAMKKTTITSINRQTIKI